MQHGDDPAGAMASDPETETQFGEEPEEESGGGYGNHAVPDAGEEPAQPDKDGR